MKRYGKPIYRNGDLVEILSPNMYIRCGYPYSFEVAKNEMETVFIDDIIRFKDSIYEKLKPKIKNSEFETSQILDTNFITISETRFVNLIIKSLAYEKVHFEKFGGTYRKVITKFNEQYMGCKGVVVNKKIVQSGKYSVDSNFDKNSKRYIYDKKLESIERHVILDIACDKYPNEMLKIEDIYVKKIPEINYIDE